MHRRPAHRTFRVCHVESKKACPAIVVNLGPYSSPPCINRGHTLLCEKCKDFDPSVGSISQ